MATFPAIARENRLVKTQSKRNRSSRRFQIATNLVILGSSALQTADYETCAFIVSFDTESVLIDCGPGIPRQLQVAEIDLISISTIVITHMHGDHVAGLPYLLFRIAQEARQRLEGSRPVRICAAGEILSEIKELLQLQYPAGYTGVTLEFEALNFAEPLQYDLFSLSSCASKHAVPTASIAIETKCWKVAYSSDCIYSPEFVRIAQGADIMLHEAFGTDSERVVADRALHALADDAGKAAEAASAGKLVLMHMLPKYREDPGPLIRDASLHFAGQIVVPRELDSFQLAEEC